MSEKNSSQSLENFRHLQASHKIITIIKQSKSQIEDLMDNLPDLYCIIDKKGNILKGNYVLADFFQIDIENLLGMNLSQIFSSRDWEAFTKNFLQIKENESIKFELKCHDSQDQIKIYNWQIHRMNQETSEFQLFSVLASNITQLRRREQELQKLTENLQEIVKEKTANITLLLDSIDRAIFSIGMDMVVNEVHSSAAEKIFAKQNFTNLHLQDLVPMNDSELGDFFSWLQMISAQNRLTKFNKYVKLCPINQMKIKNSNGELRDIKFEYRPIVIDHKFSQLLFMCSDITERLQAEKALEDSEKERKLFDQRLVAVAKNGRFSIMIFFEELRNVFQKISSINELSTLKKQAKILYRDLHTLKGNAGSLGFEELVKIVHDLEDIVFDLTQGGDSYDKSLDEWRALHTALKEEYNELLAIKSMLLSDQSDTMMISKTQYEKLLGQITAGEINDMAEVRERVYNLNTYPFGEFCKKYNSIIRSYVDKFAKQIKDLNIENSERRIHSDIMSKVDAPITHIIRNACDHGIESNEERKLKKKGPGEISISFLIKDGHIYFTIKDNGQGINTETIKRKAITKKIVSEAEAEQLTEDEIINFIFLPEFSTKDHVSHISGRGAGMDAVKFILEENKGSVQVSSQSDQGTTFTLKLPLD